MNRLHIRFYYFVTFHGKSYGKLDIESSILKNMLLSYDIA